jgi:site-specific DNA-methyltransferase (adenine-specific)
MKYNKERSKKFGEVFTPLSLVNEMLDALPTEVWVEYNCKWLDPCAGRNGIFPIEVYKRLMVSLASQEPDKEKLDKHIWDNMIYMVELQEDAVELLKEQITEARLNQLQ